jgi:hypothetical protein
MSSSGLYGLYWADDDDDRRNIIALLMSLLELRWKHKENGLQLEITTVTTEKQLGPMSRIFQSTEEFEFIHF